MIFRVTTTVHSLFVLLASCCLLGCSTPTSSLRIGKRVGKISTNSICGPPETIVLPAESVHGGFGLQNRFPFWTPTTNDVAEALSLLPGNYPGLRKLNSTLCQAVGITVEGKKAIFLNCFPPEDRWMEYWEKTLIITYDFGPRYWSIVYLPEKRSFTDLWIDGGL